MTRRFLLTIDLEGAHAPDAIGFLRDLADAGYVLHSAVTLEHSYGTPGHRVDHLPLPRIVTQLKAPPLTAAADDTDEPADS